jgi:protease I
VTGSEPSLRVAFLVANVGIEESELVEPWRAVERAGWEPVLIAPEAGEAKTVRHLEPSGTRSVDDVTSEAQPAAFDALVLPGGVANADALRTDAAAVRFATAIADTGKPIAAICHGPGPSSRETSCGTGP